MAVHKPTLDDVFLALTGKLRQSKRRRNNMAVELEFDKEPRIVTAVTDSLIMIRSSTHIMRNTDPVAWYVLSANYVFGVIYGSIWQLQSQQVVEVIRTF